MEKVLIYTDGGARGNPGRAGAGVVIQKDGQTIVALKKFLGERRTNNWAEYEALILALTEAKKRGLAGKDIEIRMDSELIVRQMTNEYQIKEEALWPQYMKAHNLLVAHFPNTKFTHIGREENKEADRLVNEAVDSGI